MAPSTIMTFLLLLLLLLQWNCVDLLQVLQSPLDLVLRPGSPAKVTCSVYGTSSPFTYWYRLTPTEGIRSWFSSLGTGSVDPPSRDGFGASRPNDSHFVLESAGVAEADPAVWYCAGSTSNLGQAYFGNGTKLTVLDSGINITRPTVKVLPPSNREGCEKKKTNRTLVCVATGFYPDHITVSWKVNGVSVTRGVRTDDTALRDEGTRFYSITSRLRVSYRKWFDTRSTFTCLTSFYDGSEYQEDKDSIKGVNGGGMDREYLLKSGLTAKLSYSVFIAKSFLYGLFISAVVWKIRSSVAKRYD